MKNNLQVHKLAVTTPLDVLPPLHLLLVQLLKVPAHILHRLLNEVFIARLVQECLD